MAQGALAPWRAGATPERFHRSVNSRQQLNHLRSYGFCCWSSFGNPMVIVWKRARGGGSGCWVMPLASHSMRLVHGSVGGMKDVSGGYASVCKVTAKGIPRCDILLDRRGHMRLIWGQSQVAKHSSISSAAPRPRQPSGTFHV